MTFVIFAGAVALAMFGVGYGHGRSVWRSKLPPATRWQLGNARKSGRADLRMVTDRPDVASRLSTLGPDTERIREDMAALRLRITTLTLLPGIPREIWVELCGIDAGMRAMCHAAGVPTSTVRLVPVDPDETDGPEAA